MLTGNGTFSVESFYNFLNNGRLRYLVARFFWEILAKENQLIQLVGVKGHDLFHGESPEKTM